MLTIAIAKGRIMNDSTRLLSKSGWNLDFLQLDSRKLIFSDFDQGLRIILTKPVDVPTYVEYGAADLGIVGKDIIMEQAGDYYELLDLKIASCRMSVAVAADKKQWPTSVATKYPRIAEEFFFSHGQQVEIIKLNGSIELAPLLGLAGGIVDLVSSGKTLQENRLIELKVITPITARLIANRSSYQLKDVEIKTFIERLEEIVEEGIEQC